MLTVPRGQDDRHRREHVEGCATLSDELPAYGNLKTMGYIHEVVNHSLEFSTDEA
jgi:hypothetical protein